MQRSMRRIGLIGGITWAATADYYQRINLGINRRLGGHHSADMLVRSLDLHPLLERADQVAEVSAVFESAAHDLHEGGAQLLAVASFTGHRYAAALRHTPMQFIDLTATVATRLRVAGFARTAIWATSYALSDQALLDRLADGSATQLLLPPVERRSELDRIIFDELAGQRMSDASIVLLRNLLDGAAAAGAEALLLATTDLSPVATLLDSSLPILDASEIHCQALVDAALGSSPEDRS